MPVMIPRATLSELSAIDDPDEFKERVFLKLGDLSRFELMANRVLVAVYIQHERTKGGIIKPLDTVAEDIWQGKPGLVIALGPMAFRDDEHTSFGGQAARSGDWVTFGRIAQSSQIEICSVPCRIVKDEAIEMIYSDPRLVTS